MLFRIRFLMIAAFCDFFIILVLFPTPLRLFISNFIDISDGISLIYFSFFALAVNIFLLAWCFFDCLRGRLSKDNINWYFYISLCVVVLYVAIGVIALYQMYVVGLT